MRERKCKDCGEPFLPFALERVCLDCKMEREIEREELRESRKAK